MKQLETVDQMHNVKIELSARVAESWTSFIAHSTLIRTNVFSSNVGHNKMWW